MTSELQRRARRAYELARLRRALRRVWWPWPIAACTALECCPPSLALAGALVASGWMVLLGWRGGEIERGIVPGFGAGAAAALLPAIAGAGITASLSPAECLPLCIAGGALAGIWVGRRIRRSPDAITFALGALPLAIVVGGFGCLLAGVAGVLGMAAAMAVASAPFLALRAR
jgi:hypothetical protein